MRKSKGNNSIRLAKNTLKHVDSVMKIKTSFVLPDRKAEIDGSDTDLVDFDALSFDAQSRVSVNRSSIYGFSISEDQESVSTIVEKLVNERLKLGMIKTPKGDSFARQSFKMIIPASTEAISSEQGSSAYDLPFVETCLKRYEEQSKIKSKILEEGPEPESNPENVIEPNFSEPEDDGDAPYKNPFNDVYMHLNRTRSYYTPNGFIDFKQELKRLKHEKERMWNKLGEDRYTKLLYEEAVKQLKNVRIDDDSLEDADDAIAVTKSINSLIDIVQHKELPPEEWIPPPELVVDKYAPFWVTAPPESTNKAINTIRFIFQTLNNTDFSKQPLKRKKDVRLSKVCEISEELDGSIVTKAEESSSSEDEPYLLKKMESVFTKKKVDVKNVEVVKKEELIELEGKQGLYNIQIGHEPSITNIKRLYPDVMEEESAEEEENMMRVDESESFLDETLSDIADETTIMNATKAVHRLVAPRESWLAMDEIDSSASSESLFVIDELDKKEPEKDSNTCPKLIFKTKEGFPMLRQRPKWITLKRECLEKNSDDYQTVERYRCLCLNRNIPPFESVARSIKKRSAVFDRMGRGPEDTIKTMTQVLGTQTKLIDLTGYYLSKTDVCHLSRAVKRLPFLAKLRLQRTQLTEEKLESLIQVMPSCYQLCLLDLSYNYNLKKITRHLMKSLSPSVKTLNLSHCSLTTDSFAALAVLPPTVESLDISWNELYDPFGLKSFVHSLVKKKSYLQELRISWNSIEGVETARNLSYLAVKLNHLMYLDISFNRFSTVPEMSIFKEMLMSSAVNLKYLIMSGNPLGRAAPETLLNDLSWRSPPKIKLIDLGDLWVSKDLYKVCEAYKDMHNIVIKVGGIKCNVDMSNVDYSVLHLKRLHFLNTPKSNKRAKNTFGSLLEIFLHDRKNSETTVKANKFKNWLENCGLKLEDGLSDSLSKSLSDTDKQIDLQMVINKYRALYPEEDVDDTKKKKEKKTKKKVVIDGGEDESEVEIMGENPVPDDPSTENIVFTMDDENLIEPI